ncbi:MAG: hypothetical protein ACYDA6_07975, partial [Solirubrobacteraceae bacterium]
AFGPVPVRRYSYILSDALLPRDLGPYSVGPGDDCLMIGRYVNHLGEQFERSVVRFGNLAMLPELIWQEGRSFEQESFLVDMRSVPGFSGSQVVVYFPESGSRGVAKPEGGIPVEGWSVKIGCAWLLGINWGHLPAVDNLLDDDGKKIGRVRLPTGMVGVVPAWKLGELLNEPTKVKPERERAEAALAEDHPAARQLDESRSDEFERFESTLSKLAQVPKSWWWCLRHPLRRAPPGR